MTRQVLYDSVSLQHLAVAHRLTILEGIHGGRAEPRWVTSVQIEISSGTSRHAHCRDVIAYAWLGTPKDPSNLVEVFRLQKALSSAGDPPTKHLGEAMSIALAEELDGNFITDDGPAYDYARNRVRLGPGRVADTCALLADAVSVGEITIAESRVAHETIINAGRYLRRCKCF